jgi:hypothetical protein
MFGHDFYHGTIRRYVIMFGNLFNEIQVKRFDQNGNKIQTINVPITYGPKSKMIERVQADPTLNRAISTTLPRMGFALDSMGYNPSRKLNTATQFIKRSGTQPDQFSSMYAPVPYDFQFSLSILTKNSEDGIQIVEQIVPFFTPDYTVTMKALPELDLRLDVPIELGAVSSDDSYEGGIEDKRVLSWDLSFTVKGYLFGPITRGKYITQADINFFDIDQPDTIIGTEHIE